MQHALNDKQSHGQSNTSTPENDHPEEQWQ